MENYSDVVLVYPDDPTIDFLAPIKDAFLSSFPKIKLHSPEPGSFGSVITDDTDLVIFLGHGASSTLFGSVNDSGAKTTFVDVEKGMLLFEDISVFLLACNSNSYIKKVTTRTKLKSSFGFGDMPTDWEHIQHNRDLEPNFLLDIYEEHLEYYKKNIVASVVSGIAYSTGNISFRNLYRGISHWASNTINDIIFNQEWTKAQKLQMIELFIDFKNNLKYSIGL